MATSQPELREGVADEEGEEQKVAAGEFEPGEGEGRRQADHRGKRRDHEAKAARLIPSAPTHRRAPASAYQNFRPNCCGMIDGVAPHSVNAQMPTTTRGKTMTKVSTSGEGDAGPVDAAGEWRRSLPRQLFPWLLGDGAHVEEPEDDAEGEAHDRLRDGVRRRR